MTVRLSRCLPRPLRRAFLHECGDPLRCFRTADRLRKFPCSVIQHGTHVLACNVEDDCLGHGVGLRRTTQNLLQVGVQSLLQLGIVGSSFVYHPELERFFTVEKRTGQADLCVGLGDGDIRNAGDAKGVRHHHALLRFVEYRQRVTEHAAGIARIDDAVVEQPAR